MSNVSINLNSVREKIRNAYLKRAVDLRHSEPRLVAVSKTKSKELILEAYKCGQRHFGENYVQEIVEKGFDEDIIRACPEIKWHFIGHLQRNKVHKLLSVPKLHIVETVDSQKLADALNTGVSKFSQNFHEKLNVFIQVNTSGEAAKSGCKIDETTDLVKYVMEKCENLLVLGLMTIGKYDNYDSQQGINPDFQALIDCRLKVCKELELDVNKFELSMGMSGDFEHAVEVGATNVRVGSLIFGERALGSMQQASLKGDNQYRKVHKILKFYSNNFGFRKPYQVLIDGTICVAALKNKINIQEQFPKYLDDVKLLTTQCIIKEVEKLGPATFGALLIIKKFGIHNCGHTKSPVPASNCILSMIGEKNVSRYIIASQDRELQQRCRRIQSVPLLYLHSRTPVLEPPSSLTQGAADQKTTCSFSVSEFEKQKLSLLKQEGGEEIKKKRKRKGEPNPLSCKKKKKKLEESGQPNRGHLNKRKRKRNRSRIVKKIKNELMATLNTVT